MHTRIVKILCAVTLLTSGWGCASQKNQNFKKSEIKKPLIATTIVPLTIVVKNIVGDSADVQSVLPHGAEPHDVVLSPTEISAIQHAQVVVKLGLGLDSWVDKGIEATEQHPIVINVGELLHIPAQSDPHIWLSPRRMLRIIDALNTEISRALPEIKETTQTNAAAYRKKIENIDTIYNSTATFSSHEIVTLHNAFSYLAADYNIKIIGVIKNIPEDSPSPTDIARIITTLKKFPDAPLFAESEIQPAIIATIARDTKRTTYILDPLETGSLDLDAYEHIMLKNFAELERALNKPKM